MTTKKETAGSKSAKPKKKLSLKVGTGCPSREDSIRQLAYLNWLNLTGGQVVSDEQTRQFWLDAEREIDSQAS